MFTSCAVSSRYMKVMKAKCVYNVHTNIHIPVVYTSVVGLSSGLILYTKAYSMQLPKGN